MLQTEDAHALYIWVDELFWQDGKATHASTSAIKRMALRGNEALCVCLVMVVNPLIH
jgi:hypothetical protein